MRETEMHDCDLNGDPAPSVATNAEIELAERLRHELEERYLARAAPLASSQPSPRGTRGASHCD